MSNGTPLLEVKNLKKYFVRTRGFRRQITGNVKAVDDVSFTVHSGETLALVGESGCGKTTTGRCIQRALDPSSGEVLFHTDEENAVDISMLNRRDLKEVMTQMGMIFQDPYSSLNPRMTVFQTIAEPFVIHRTIKSREEMEDRVAELLRMVRLDPIYMMRYPHAFSGGQRQRICIARALAVEPQLLICDESVSALDVSVQAQVLNLLKELQANRGLTYIFISHDLSVVKFMSDMMAVMNDGVFVEFGPSESIYDSPRKSYTKRLIDAVPRDTLEQIDKRQEDRITAARI